MSASQCRLRDLTYREHRSLFIGVGHVVHFRLQPIGQTRDKTLHLHEGILTSASIKLHVRNITPEILLLLVQCLLLIARRLSFLLSAGDDAPRCARRYYHTPPTANSAVPQSSGSCSPTLCRDSAISAAAMERNGSATM